MIAIPTTENKIKSQCNVYSERCRSVCTTCGDPFCRKHLGVFFMEHGFTCANHTEEVALDKIGWNNFICPRCGSDYSIGRKIVISESKSFRKYEI